MSTYFWDIGIDLNDPNKILRSGLVVVFDLPSQNTRQAMSLSNALFLAGDTVIFNVFNITFPTIVMSGLSGSIDFANGNCPFENTSSPIPVTGSGIGQAGQSAYFLESTYYPHWAQGTFVIAPNPGTYFFSAVLTVTKFDGSEVVLSLPDPEMIVGSSGSPNVQFFGESSAINR